MQLIKCMAIRCNIIRESNVNPFACGTGTSRALRNSVHICLGDAVQRAPHSTRVNEDCGCRRRQALFPGIFSHHSLPKDDPSAVNKFPLQPSMHLIYFELRNPCSGCMFAMQVHIAVYFYLMY